MNPISIPLFAYILKAAMRDRLVISILVLMAVGTSLAIFLGSSAIVETLQFAVVFTAGGLRIAGVLAITLFISFFIRRAFDGNDIDFLLTRPISRFQYICTHAAAFTSFAVVLALLISVILCVLLNGNINYGVFLWAFSLAGEFIIIANVTLFFTMVLPNAMTSCLAVLGFYTLARMLGQILGIIATNAVSGFSFLPELMNFISLFIPRLDLMAQSAWLIYESDFSFSPVIIAVQTIFFSALVVSAAIFDLSRRDF